MNNYNEQILETWRINHEINLMLLEELSDEALGFSTSKRGGGNVGHQLAHLYNIRLMFLEIMDKPLAEGLVKVKAEDPKSVAMLRELQEVSYLRMTKMLESGIANDGKLKGYKRGVIPFLGYFLTHEAHHRGNIVLTLKNSGFKISDRLKFGIWEWTKI